MDRREFVAKLGDVIETASNSLIEEGQREQAELFGRVPTPLAYAEKAPADPA